DKAGKTVVRCVYGSHRQFSYLLFGLSLIPRFPLWYCWTVPLVRPMMICLASRDASMTESVGPIIHRLSSRSLNATPVNFRMTRMLTDFIENGRERDELELVFFF